MRSKYLFLASLLLIGLFASAQNKRIGVLGSSTANGQGIPSDSSWVQKLKVYYRNAMMIDTLHKVAASTLDCYSGMPTGYIPPMDRNVPNTSYNITRLMSRAPKPTTVIVSYPTNNYNIFSDAEILFCLDSIKKIVNSTGAVCFITTTQPRDNFTDAGRARLKYLRDLIKDHYGNYAIDFFTPVYNPDNNKIKAEYALGDGIHLNPKGHEVLFQQVLAKNIFSFDLPANPLNQDTFVKVSVKAFLQGAYSENLGRHKDVTLAWSLILNVNALNQPYNAAPFNYIGTEAVSPGFFTSDAGSSADVIDWVLLELRDATDPATVIASRAALIREDGQIVDTDGSSAVSFPGVNAGNYYIMVRHRNHLSVRSATAIALSSTASSYDFTTGQGKAFQNETISNAQMATKDLNGTLTNVTMLWGGNANGDGLVRASGGASMNDYLTLMNPGMLNGNTSIIITNIYRAEDINLDGVLRASAGTSTNDYLILMGLGMLNGNTSAIIRAHK